MTDPETCEAAHIIPPEVRKMSPADQWLDRYGESHNHTINKLLHWVCVPLIVVSLIGLLWSVPVPAAFRDTSAALNWGTVFLMAAIVYYFIMSISLAFGILPFVAAVVATVAWLDTLSAPLPILSLSIFALSWAGQFFGHWLEGKRPSFFEDLQFLMIGPVWLLAAVYRRLGIPY
jgi:uncharacterized membrane protein YGL010W